MSTYIDIIKSIHDDFVNNRITIKQLKEKNLPLEIKINIKDEITYYICYIWHEYTKDSYFKDISDYVIIPNTSISLYDIDDFFNVYHYIKYKMKDSIIKIKNIKKPLSKKIIICKNCNEELSGDYCDCYE